MDVGETTNDVGESTLDVGELTVGETTRRRNDRKPFQLFFNLVWALPLDTGQESNVGKSLYFGVV